MSKFLLKKRFSLAFLGEEWEKQNTYLDLNAFTSNDVLVKLPKLATMDEKNMESVGTGLSEMVDLLKENFISGKGIGSDGKVIDITKEDIGSLSLEAISKAINFLSQGWQEETQLPSETSSQQKD